MSTGSSSGGATPVQIDNLRLVKFPTSNWNPRELGENRYTTLNACYLIITGSGFNRRAIVKVRSPEGRIVEIETYQEDTTKIHYWFAYLPYTGSSTGGGGGSGTEEGGEEKPDPSGDLIITLTVTVETTDGSDEGTVP